MRPDSQSQSSESYLPLTDHFPPLSSFLNRFDPPGTLDSPAVASSSEALPRATQARSLVMASLPTDQQAVLQQLPPYLWDTPYADYILRTPESKRSSVLVPTEWNSKDKANDLEVVASNLQVNYVGPGQRDADAASIRANRPIPPQCGIYYYEIQIVDKGHDGYIGMGLAYGSVNTRRLPGWEPHSWGYHGDDGNSFSGSGSGRPYGPTYSTDDVVGCCINLWAQQVFFTKNGVRLHTAFRDVKGPLYPIVGMRTQDEKLLGNFGQKAFKFDIGHYYQEEKHRLWHLIKATPAKPLPSYPELGLLAAMRGTKAAATDEPMDATETTEGDAPSHLDITNDLVLSYFIHHGYRQTARAFVQNVLGTPQPFGAKPSHSGATSAMAVDLPATDATALSLQRVLTGLDDQDAEIQMRQKISRLILAGDMDTALRLTQQHYPKVFRSNESVYFRLRCQLFVELMRRAGGAQAVSMLEDQGDLDLDADSDDDATHAPLDPDGRDAMGMELEPSPDPLASGAKPRTTLTSADFLRRALKCGRRLQRDYTHNSGESVRKSLVEVFALLAYPDPSHSPVAYLLDESRRADLVHMLNEEILVSQNKPRIPPLEMAYAQSKVVLDELVKNGSAAANLIQINKDMSL